MNIKRNVKRKISGRIKALVDENLDLQKKREVQEIINMQVNIIQFLNCF